jgi:hypothetical protein
MPNYSNALTKQWLESINEFHPEDEVREEAWYLVRMFEGEAHKQHKKYMTEFIDTNKLETVRNRPLKINK